MSGQLINSTVHRNSSAQACCAAEESSLSLWHRSFRKDKTQPDCKPLVANPWQLLSLWCLSLKQTHGWANMNTHTLTVSSNLLLFMQTHYVEHIVCYVWEQCFTALHFILKQFSTSQDPTYCQRWRIKRSGETGRLWHNILIIPCVTIAPLRGPCLPWLSEEGC